MNRTSRSIAALGTSAGLAGLLLAGQALGLAGAAGSASAATKRATVAVPATPSGLPAGIEDLAGYVAQTSCDPVAKPGAVALGRLLAATYPGIGYVVARPCGTETVVAEHADGRGLDWLVSARNTTQKADADAFLSWLLATDSSGRPFANARRLGVMYVIWNNRIWGAYNPLAGWQPYSTCASHTETGADAICHRDRLHVSLSWAGAMARTSFWSKAVAGPDYGPCRPKDLNWSPAYTTRNATGCPSYPAVTAPSGASATLAALVTYSGATVGPGSAGPVVSAVQRALGVTADGDYGPYTADAVAALQRKHSLPASGAMDAATWRVLLAANSPAAQAAPKPADKPATNPLTKYKNTVLKYDSRGDAVLALQRRLGVTASGWFGPKTRAAVVAFQVTAKLPATGVVDAATWKALGA